MGSRKKRKEDTHHQASLLLLLPQTLEIPLTQSHGKEAAPGRKPYYPVSSGNQSPTLTSEQALALAASVSETEDIVWMDAATHRGKA